MNCDVKRPSNKYVPSDLIIFTLISQRLKYSLVLLIVPMIQTHQEAIAANQATLAEVELKIRIEDLTHYNKICETES